MVLSAQTTDGKVNEVTSILFDKAPTAQLMAQMSVEEIQAIIQPVGLAPAKAKYLKKLSHDIVTKFGGNVPSTYETLESLPGVGHKTASVMMSQAFGENALAVDTHVHRVAGRWGLSSQTNVDKVQKDLHAIFPQGIISMSHIILMHIPMHTITH